MTRRAANPQKPRKKSQTGAIPRSTDREETGQPNDAEGRSKRAREGGPAAGLHIVATPIGNAGDISARALDILRGVDVIACEDTRITGHLLSIYRIATPTLSYHEHNATRVRPRLLARLRGGAAIALVSDAGTPLISDPGYRLVGACLEAGIAVTTAPGPSAALAALTLSGLPSDRFLFVGFPAPRSAARRSALAEVATVRASLIFYESARRLAASLADMEAVLGGERQAAVARELTKKFEEVRRGSLAELAADYSQEPAPKGEIVIVVGPPLAIAADDDAVDALLRDALARLSLRDAAAAVALASGRPRREVYARALELANQAS